MISINSDDLTILNGTIDDEVSISGGSVTFEDVTMNREGRCVTIHGGSVVIGSGCSLTTTGNSATVAIFGVEDGSDAVPSVTVEGKIVNTYKAVNANGEYEEDGQFALSGNVSSKYGPVTMNIKDGAEIISENCIAVYHPNDGELNMTGGTVEGLTAINTKGGTVNISGGKLVGKGNWDWRYSLGGAYSTGDALAIENIGYPKAGAAGPVVNITGDVTITSEHHQPVEVFYAERDTNNKDIAASHMTLSTAVTDANTAYHTKMLNYINDSVHIATTVVTTPALYADLRNINDAQ